MNNKTRTQKEVLSIKKEELQKEKREKAWHYFFMSILLISILLLVIVISLHVLRSTGYIGYIDSQAGYITQVSVTSKTNVSIWGGIYGLALRVPDFTEQLSEELDAGTVERTDIFFDCLQTDAQGGPEVYASTNPSLTISPSTVSAGTAAMVDSFMGCSNEAFCANNTFTRNMTLFVGSTNLSGIPSTYTYKYNGENELYDIGVLNISGNLAFVAHVNKTIQKGYNPNSLVNYQMLLPTPANTTTNYYFYADPNDVCPSGGIGSTIDTVIYGYTLDTSGNILGDVSVALAGSSVLTNSSSGFYNLTASVLEGTYNVIAQKNDYDANITNVTINSTNYIIYRNITLKLANTATGDNSASPTISGTVKDTGGNVLTGVNVSMGNATIVSNSSGYSFNPLVVIGRQPIIGIKENYDNYVAYLDITSSTTNINHNITMEPANLEDFPVQVTTTGVDEEGDAENEETAKAEAEKAGQDFWVSAQEINKQVRENTFIEDKISIYNFKGGAMNVVFSASPEIEEILKLDKSALSIGSNSFESVIVTVSGTKPIGIYKGILKITGDLDVEIPVKIEIVPKKLPVETLDMDIELFKDSINTGENLKYRLNLQNLLTEQGYIINLRHVVLDSNSSEVIIEETEDVEIKNSLSLLKELEFEESIEEGEYVLRIEANYAALSSSVTSPFTIKKPVYLYAFFGIPLWLIFTMISIFSFVLLNVFLYKKHVNKKKRYHLALRLETLPRPGERSIKIGKIAEKNIDAFYNLDDLTTHAIVAGATGGGKSISAQVFVEEALMKGIAVIVFDPTAQWSGMLRKCDDKKMFSFYPKFGLKPSDAKAFAGNVRQIKNHLESLDVNKYVNPGQIQIFTMNKLDPSQIDIFVAGVISNIFKSDPKEYSGLRVMLVFDEVHRLLPKFGGSGKGFLQIERACREFRKWGFGVMLVSQVLSDFVGEIKANINTEVQMRVAEENDLERIKERYGLDALKSLVRADVGTGMIQNAEYNKGLPYFVNLRPILHSTRRLADDILEKYNNYNEIVDDLEYQIQQLEQEKIDVFDLKMELKLVKDKLMTGNFTVVDIYLEGLKPRVEKYWQQLGKKPKKKELKLINVAELESSLVKAANERQKWEQQNKKEESSIEKKEDKGTKIVRPLTFDNGMMVSSLNELRDVLSNFDDSVFKLHVNDAKNDIAEWVGKEVDTSLGEKLKIIKSKIEMLKILQAFGKEIKEETKTVQKEDAKAGEKNKK